MSTVCLFVYFLQADQCWYLTVGGRKCGMELDVYGLRKGEKKHVGGGDCNVISQYALSVHVSGAAVSCAVRWKKTKETRYERTHSATIVQKCDGLWGQTISVGRQISARSACTKYSVFSFATESCLLVGSHSLKFASRSLKNSCTICSHQSSLLPLILGEASIAVCIFFVLLPPLEEGWNESVLIDVIQTASATKEEEDLIQDSISGSFSSQARRTSAHIFKSWCLLLTYTL